MSPRRTLANTKLPPIMDSETTPTNSLYIMQTLVDSFHKIVRHHRWIQRRGIVLALLLIMLAFLAMVQKRRDLKMRPHCVQQPDYTLPRLPEETECP